MFDLLIRNGYIIDGTGKDGFVASIGIQDGKIIAIGDLQESAEKVIDATGLAVTPGFIDSHSHSDTNLFASAETIEKLEQGITTAIAGQCGSSAAPAKIPADQDVYKEGIGQKSQVCASAGAFLDTMHSVALGANHMCLVGAGNLRKIVLGMEQRNPTADEMEQMKAMLRDGMEHGALGISFGLIYPPCCYFTTDEMVELAKVVAEYNGIAAAHIRNEGKTALDAQEEFITILKRSGVRGIHSHMKSAGAPEFRNKVPILLKNIEKARAEGIDLYFDVYPYIASHTTLSVSIVPDCGRDLLPRLTDPVERAAIKEWDQTQTWWKGDLSWVLIAKCANHPEYEGKFISEIAQERGVDHIDAALDMILDSKNACSACYFTMDEADVEAAINHPLGMICTDSGVALGRTVFHPRLKSSFPRAIAKYSRREGLPSLEEMVRKMTSLPASVYGLAQKGRIALGMDADLCIFHPEEFTDQSTFTQPNQRCKGLHYVIVSGQVAVENSIFNGCLAGKLILHKK
jgi:N-acyl-D-amino-acid deacylase